MIRELDFEEQSIYHFQIKAKDGAWVPKTGTLNVTVIVMDVDDNPPVFSSSEYVTSVPENSAVGTNVLEVMATDMDSAANAQIFYSLVGGHVDKFAVDSGNGSITTLAIFDYEQEQMFELTIKASNTGGHALFSITHVVIQISDVNEFTPTFTKKEFNFSALKNVPVGTVIGKVTATDGDRGSEGEMFYLLFGQKKNLGFEIHERSGDVFTTSSLRKRGNSHVVLKVLVKNSGVITGMDIDETFVHISVIDTNEGPMFASAWYAANVTEDSPAGTSVVTVSAVDQDSIADWNNFFFSFEHGNTNFSFSIDPSSGVISVNSPLDREVWPVYNLTVTATDNGFPPATGTTHVIVTVGDINDNAPKLTSTEAQVKENQPEGTIVTRLTAYDSDLPPNQGPFTFWLLDSSVGSAFSLTPDGVLLTTRPIDREQISSYRILVAIRDAGIPLALSSTSTFHIRVMDENDNPSLPRNIFIEVKYFGSSFRGGMIGNVHPEDRDVSDTFNCAIKSGPVNMFTIPNGTCELWSSPFQGEATFNISVEATDQLHFPVNNSIYVNYKGFTNASIDSCILFYVSSSSMEQFLSNNYLRFVKALDSLFNLQASKTHVFGIKHIGSEILLLAAVKNYNGQYLSREVASGISAGHKKLLEAQSNVTITHIISDPCLTSPCQNGASCQKNIYINQDVAVLESVGVIFVSPKTEIFNCACPAGFTGSLCEEDVDECELSPCENKGTCVNTAGSFYCHCQVSFSDSDCAAGVDGCLKVKCQNGGTCVPSADGFQCHCTPGFEEICEEFIDHCKSAPCVLGTCTSLQSGFTCNCPFVSGVRCEDHSYGFEELSFMEFPPLDRRTNLISLEFATVQRNSLLLYNPGGSNSREFFALEILDGAMQLSYDLGSGPVKLQTYKQVADGYFHSVTARRIGNTLDVGNSNMTFGGLRTTEPILVHPAQIKTHDFVGCIRNIHINGILLRPSMALAAYNIFDCPRAAVSPCYSVPCKNGGVCHDLWSDYFCECKSSFTGRNCDKMSEELVLRFNGSDYIDYVIKEKFKRDYLMKEILDEKIKDRKPAYTFKDTLSGHLSDFTVDPPVADGVWHLLSLFSDGQNTFFSVDGKPVLNITGQSLDLTPVSVEKIVLGAAPTRETVQSFSGCVQYFNVTGYSLPVSGHSVMVDVRPSSTLSQSSCSSPDVCLPSPCSEEDVAERTCLSNCQNQWKCGLDVQNKFCICLHNVSDHFCDRCIVTKDGHDQCSEMQGNMPLWLIALVLPLIFILVIAASCVVLYRVRHSDARCQSEGLPVKTEQGADNIAFSLDDNAEAVSPEKGNGPDRMSANQAKSSIEIYCDNGLSSVQPLPKSELEYYEIS
uniref:Si:dkey-1m11.6 n=1 Tax=Amphilophus citrinellus TaxID=61819 RepID=A0A3Q0R1P0_AMPCI